MQGIGLIRLTIGILESPFECGIEPLGSISHVIKDYQFDNKCENLSKKCDLFDGEVWKYTNGLSFVVYTFR